MTTLSYILLFTSVFDILFSFIIFFKARNSERQLALHYFILFAVIGVWELSMWAAFFVHLQPALDFIIHASSYALGIMSFFHLLLFVWVLSGKQFLSHIVMKTLATATYLIAALTFIPGLIILNTEATAGAQSTPGPLMGLFYLMLIPMFVGIVYVAVRGTRSSQDQLAKKRMRLIGAGVIIVVCSNTFSSVVLPYYFKIVRSEIVFVDSGWVATQQVISVILLSVLSFITAYAITRYRFMGIQVQVKQRIGYTVILLALVILCISLGIIVEFYFGVIVAIIVVTLLSFIYFQFFDKRIRFMLDSIFFLNVLDPSKAYTYDERKFDSYKTLIPWIDRMDGRFAKYDVHFLGIYMLQRQHNRLTNPKNNKHIWHSSDFVQELMSCEDGIYEPENLRAAFPRAMKKANAVLSIKQHEYMQGLFFLQIDSDKIEAFTAMIPYIAQEAVIEVRYYEAIEGSKRTVKELIYKDS